MVASLYSYSYPSSDKIETYVSKSRSMSLRPQQLSNFLFAQQMEDSTKVERTDSIQTLGTGTVKLKSPYWALFYAVMPGMFYHGAGHFYAGERKIAIILFMIGTGGSFVALAGVMGDPAPEMDDETSNGENQIDDETRDRALWVAAVLFFSTWIYDLVDAPLAVKRQNKKLLKKQNLGLEFDFDDRSKVVRCQIVKRF
jgi:hypothetical protein